MNENLSYQKFDQSWGVGPLPAFPDKPLHEILRETAARVPKKDAVISLHYRLSYEDLNLYSDRFAVYLAELGLKKGDRVATMLPNCIQHAIAIYGILKAGCTMVPFNVMLKGQEAQYILEESEAKVLVCLDLLLPMVRPVAESLGLTKVVTVHVKDFSAPTATIPPMLSGDKQPVDGATDFMAIIKADQGDVPYVHVDLKKDLACILYTSGTTGFPKGAMITHYNYHANSNVVLGPLGLTGEDTIMLLFPLFHVGGQALILFPAVRSGATCVAIPVFSPGDTLDLIQRFGISYTFAPPTAYIGLLNHPDFNKFNLSSLRMTTSSGALVPAALKKQWEEAIGTYLFAGYGCTESTAASPGIVEQVNRKNSENGCIGAALGGEMKIVDTSGNIVPRGTIGEYVLRGDGIVQGYLKKPDETRACFLEDGWWATGDAGYMNEDGFCFFVERIKDLIVASGYNIAPAEVENYLYKHPAIQEVAVIGIPDDYRGETVKAFVVLKEEEKGKVTEDDIIAFGKEAMASYKTPKLVEFIDAIPKNPSGKTLRRLLREKEDLTHKKTT